MHVKEENLNLGKLLIGFLELYGNTFDYVEDVISLRNGGCYVKKSTKNWENPSNPCALAVEDPHNPENDIGSFSFKIENVRMAFQEAYHKLYFQVCSNTNKSNNNKPRHEGKTNCWNSKSHSSTSSDSSCDYVLIPTLEQKASQNGNHHNGSPPKGSPPHESHPQESKFPCLARVLWVSGCVQGFRQRIKQVYGQHKPETSGF